MNKVSLKVTGMTCINCERHIENDLKEMEGISNVKASYQTEQVEVNFDDMLVTQEEIIKIIEQAGYKVIQKQEGFDYEALNKILGSVIIFLGGYLLLRKTGMLSILNMFPQAAENTSYGMLVVIGFLTSFHCIAMCGGINLSQCMKQEEDQSRWSSLRPSISYNMGRVVSYTIFGAVVGAVGSVVSFTGRMQGIVQLLAGVFMIIMGINMLGIFPWLRRFTVHMPKQFGAFDHAKNGPFIVGLLNGLMPCGPLQAMQLFALSTGSMYKGAFAMFLFSVGTVPLMFLLGVVSTVLSKKTAGKIVKTGAVLVVILGASMFNNGLGLTGINTSYTSAGKEVVTASKSAQGQEVTIQLQSGSYTPIEVEAGTKVRWNIRVEKGTLNGCNNKIIVREYGIEKKLEYGDNIVEFTPTEEGTYTYTCWMGMIKSKINVVAKEERG